MVIHSLGPLIWTILDLNKIKHIHKNAGFHYLAGTSSAHLLNICFEVWILLHFHFIIPQTLDEL